MVSEIIAAASPSGIRTTVSPETNLATEKMELPMCGGCRNALEDSDDYESLTTRKREESTGSRMAIFCICE